MTTDRSAASNRSVGPLATAIACGALLAIFATLSYTAVQTKSATWDEPEHLLGAFLHARHHDFRVNPEDPALFGTIASLPMGPAEFKLDLTREAYKAIADNTATQWPFIVDTLYRTGGNDAQRALAASRAACLAVGMILGAVIAWWTYRLAGGVGAIIATALYAFDPNFLGHAPLVKNDVMLSAAVLGLMFAVWRFGRRGTWPRLAAIALLAGAAVSVKYSGVLAGPFVAVALLVRALLPEPWFVVGLILDTRPRRLAAAALTCVVVAVVAYGVVWACYGFRFAPTPDPRVRLNIARVVDEVRINVYFAEQEHLKLRAGSAAADAAAVGTMEELRQRPLPRVVRVMLWLEGHRLLPQAWIFGFLYTYKSTLIRASFLMGDYRVTGWWYFFPMAMLFKMPIATLAAAMLALLVALLWKIEPRLTGQPPIRALDRWAFACLLIAPALYGISAMTTNLNLGLRHVLPLFPFIFIGAGVVLGMIFRHWAWVGRAIVAVILIGLLVETVRAYPDYIAFFNAPAGGSRGGIKLLGDSNLDWGQDLKLLAKWQREHPDKRLYISYFGVADPASYGIKAIHLPGSWGFAPVQMPDAPGVIAISATNLQAIYNPEQRAALDPLRKAEPIAILGGTIYIYPYPLPSTSPSVSQPKN
jgi:hypothetical protein